METRLLLVRHAETADPNRFHGAESDVALGLRGMQQAALLARYLATLKPRALYCSPMRRALETARPIAEATGLSVEIIADLYERRMGALSGLSREDGWPRYAAEKARWQAGALDFALDGAESYLDVRARALPALEHMIGTNQGRTIVVVCHGVVIRVVLTSVLPELPPAQFNQVGIGTASINDLRFDGGSWRALALNLRPCAQSGQGPEETASASECLSKGAGGSA